MGVIIVYSKIARNDLKEIYDYIRRDSLRYARREIELIRTAVLKLKQNPFRGRKFEKSDEGLTRELIFKNYRVVYDITPGKEILILTIHHHARLISNNPAFKEDE